MDRSASLHWKVAIFGYKWMIRGIHTWNVTYPFGAIARQNCVPSYGGKPYDDLKESFHTYE